MTVPAEELGITRQYLTMIISEHEQAGPKLAIRIEEWSNGEIDRKYLRPDLWG